MNTLMPMRAKVVSSKPMTQIERLVRIKIADNDASEAFRHRPGQFVELGLMRLGEAPISICTADSGQRELEFCIRNVGRVTKAIHRLVKGDTIWIWGPYGNGFPMEEMEGRDIVFVAGGLGVAPIRSVLQHILLGRSKYGKITLLYGVRNYGLVLFKDEYLDLLRKGERKGVKLYLSYEDQNDKDFAELARELPDRVTQGMVTKLFSIIEPPSKNSAAVLGGPPIMYRFVNRELAKFSLDPARIYVTLERRMRCGLGQCGHCIVGSGTDVRYVCKDGPVFTIWDAMSMRELI